MAESSQKPAIADGTNLQRVYPAGRTWNIDIPSKTLIDVIDEAVQAHGNRTFTSFKGSKISYAEAGRLIDKAAKGLQDMGVTRGTKVGLHMINTPFYPIMFFAVMKAGGTVVNIDAVDTVKDLEHKIANSGIDIVATMNLDLLSGKITYLMNQGLLKRAISCHLPDMLPPLKRKIVHGLSAIFNEKSLGCLPEKLQQSLRQIKELAHRPSHPFMLPFAKLTANDGRFKPVRASTDDIALLQYTGGTTGTPKAAIHTHGSLFANLCQMNEFHGSKPADPANAITLGIGAERVGAFLPMTHIFSGMFSFLMSVIRGNEMAMEPDPRKVDEVLKTLRDRRITTFAAVPRLEQALADRLAATGQKIPDIKCVVSGGAPLANAVRSAFENAAGHKNLILEGYGSTETLIVSCAPSYGGETPDTVGMVYPRTEVRIADTSDPEVTLSEGEAGEILIRGPQLMKGYLNNPAENAKCFTKDGWFRTGDIGTLKDGVLTIAGRIKDLIIVNGFKVYPQKIEEAVSQHPAVAECCVIGVNTGTPAEAAKLFVRFKPDAERLSQEQLNAFLAAQGALTRLEMPKHLEVWDTELPKTPLGKPDKKALRAVEVLRDLESTQKNLNQIQPRQV